MTLAADPETSGVNVGTAVGRVPALLSAIHEGAATHVAGTEAMAFPNDLAFDQRGHLYITDSAMGAVWRLARDGRSRCGRTTPCSRAQASSGWAFLSGPMAWHS
jgi:sugar lactone lactonase YvrE